MAISLKNVKIEEKLIYRNSQTLFRTVPLPTPYGLFFPKIRGSQPPPETPIAIISGTGEATEFKFSRNIHRVYPNKRPLKCWRKGNVGVSRNCLNFWVPPIISGKGKATNFKFDRNIHRIHPNKSPLKILGKRSVGVSRDCPIFGYSLLSEEQVKLRVRTLYFVRIFIASVGRKAH